MTLDELDIALAREEMAREGHVSSLDGIHYVPMREYFARKAVYYLFARACSFSFPAYAREYAESQINSALAHVEPNLETLEF